MSTLSSWCKLWCFDQQELFHSDFPQSRPFYLPLFYKSVNSNVRISLYKIDSMLADADTLLTTHVFPIVFCILLCFIHSLLFRSLAIQMLSPQHFCSVFPINKFKLNLRQDGKSRMMRIYWRCPEYVSYVDELDSTAATTSTSSNLMKICTGDSSKRRSGWSGIDQQWKGPMNGWFVGSYWWYVVRP